MPSAPFLRRAAIVALASATPLVLPLAASGEAREVATRSTVTRTLQDGSIVESSGLARSTYHRSILWTHNDSGGSPVVFAVGKHGDTRATLRLRGATERDWEDIASGPHHRIWVGDVGNNSKNRDVISVYRFKEPRRLGSHAVRNKRFDFRYPDGRHNSEGIMVNPRTGRLYIVSKDPGGGAIYRAPRALRTGKVMRLKRVAPAPEKVTAASFYPSGKRFVLCNYSKAWIYRGMHNQVATIDKPPLKQGESLEVSRGGGAILMGSEGRRSPVYRVTLR